jgi:hypothetical protein
MVKRIALAASWLVLLLLAPPTVAQDKPAAEAMAPPKPAPELVEYMKDLVGSWTCATTFPAGSMGPDSPEVKTTAKVKMSKDTSLGGMFYKGEYSVAKSKAVPMAFKGVFYMGYDAGTKQITTVSVDNMGSASMGAGPISGNTASWSGESFMMGQKVKTRETMTKVDPKNITHKVEVDMGKGFQPMGEDVCKK